MSSVTVVNVTFYLLLYCVITLNVDMRVSLCWIPLCWMSLCWVPYAECRGAIYNYQICPLKRTYSGKHPDTYACFRREHYLKGKDHYSSPPLYNSFFCIKVSNIFNLISSWSKLASTRRLTVLRLPLIEGSLAKNIYKFWPIRKKTKNILSRLR